MEARWPFSDAHPSIAATVPRSAVMYSCAMAGYGNINFAVLAGKQDKSTPGAPGAPAGAGATPDQKPN